MMGDLASSYWAQNVHIFDGTHSQLSPPSNALIRGNKIEKIPLKNTLPGSRLLATIVLAFGLRPRVHPAAERSRRSRRHIVATFKFQGSDGKTLMPGDAAKYTLVFEPDGSVSVRIDGNRGHGTWKCGGPNQLQFGPLALTRAMCPAAPLNDRIPKDWEYVRSYVLKDGHLFLSLMADGGPYEFEPQKPTVSGLPATFVGTLPCADCPGIRYQVNLLPDHTFFSRMTYEERDASFDDSGSWQFASAGKTLVLQGAREARESFALRDAATVRKLDADGHEIESKLNYDLKGAPSFAPIKPLGQGGSTAALENTYWKLTAWASRPLR